MQKALPLFLGIAFLGFVSAAQAASDEHFTAKFNFAATNVSALQFHRDVDTCVRKAGRPSPNHAGDINGADPGHVDLPSNYVNNRTDARAFLACMLEKSYRVDPNGPYDTGWLILWQRTAESNSSH